jgi:hypothetical protein
VPDYEPLRTHLLRPCERDSGQDASRKPTLWQNFFRNS